MIVRLGAVVSLVLVVLGGQGPAFASNSTRRTAIVLPVELGGFFLSRDEVKQEVTLALEDRLRAAQLDVMRKPLTPSETACNEFDCLTRIADAHRASFVVAGRLVSNQSVKVSYRLRIRVVERSPGKPVDTREREANCDNCTETQARDRLATLMSSVIENEPEPKEPVEPKTSKEPTQPTTKVRERFTPAQRWTLRLSGIAALAVGVGFLAQGFVEVAHDGEIVDHITENSRLAIRDTDKYQAVFLTLGAVSVAAGVALSVLGWKSWPVRVAAMPTLSGGQLVVSGTF
jgi:hypothetical protein